MRCIQITMAENFGVSDRGKFYDETGALRDVVQNHMLQVLGNLTMDPPTGEDHEAERDQKAALLKAVRPLKAGRRGARTVQRLQEGRGRRARFHRRNLYRDQAVHRYLALGWRSDLHSCRKDDAGHLHGGGRRIQASAAGNFPRNRARRAHRTCGCASAPTSASGFGVRVKVPGERMVGEDVELKLKSHAAAEMPPYQRLLGDAMRGNGELFARQDLVEAQWRIVQPILGNVTPVYSYEPGTWGPDEANQLIGADGPWINPTVPTRRRGQIDRSAETDVGVFCSTSTTRCSTTIVCKTICFSIWSASSAPKPASRYLAIFEELRGSWVTPIIWARWSATGSRTLHDPRLLRMANWLVDYPFAARLYPGALDVVKRVKRWGKVAILSDGDAVFQPRKVERSGLWKAFGGHVLIYIHKEQELAGVEKFYPAQHYVMVDDKLRILQAIKDVWKDRVTTVFPRQGHYAKDKKAIAQYRPADISIERIADLLEHKRNEFMAA